MTMQELQAMSVKQLRQLAMDESVELKKRWLKPKILEALYEHFNHTLDKPVADDYSDFLGVGAVVASETVKPPEEPTKEPEPQSRGGVRPGAGRPEGTDESHIRLRRAVSVKSADLNIKGGIRRLFRFRKKKPDKELIEDSAMAYTKVGEYFGIMEKIRNTPFWIFGAAIWYTWQLIQHLFRKKDDERSGTNNDDIRQAGNGQNEPGKAVSPAV